MNSLTIGIIVVIGLITAFVIADILIQNRTEPSVNSTGCENCEVNLDELKQKIDEVTKEGPIGYNKIRRALDSDQLTYQEKLAAIGMFYKDSPIIPFNEVYIKDLKKENRKDGPVTFTLVAWGYSNPCVFSTVRIYYENLDNLFWVGANNHPCPLFRENVPVLIYHYFPSSFPNTPEFTKSGKYLISAGAGLAPEIVLDEFNYDVGS